MALVDPGEADAPTNIDTQNIKKEKVRSVYHGIHLCKPPKSG
jgi:hypothetical protein